MSRAVRTPAADARPLSIADLYHQLESAVRNYEYLPEGQALDDAVQAADAIVETAIGTRATSTLEILLKIRMAAWLAGTLAGAPAKGGPAEVDQWPVGETADSEPAIEALLSIRDDVKQIIPEGAMPPAERELLELGRQLEEATSREADLLRPIETDPSAPVGDYEAARAATSKLVRRIEQMAAATTAGLKVKAKAFRWCRGGGPLFDAHELQTTDGRILKQLIEDLERL